MTFTFPQTRPWAARQITPPQLAARPTDARTDAARVVAPLRALLDEIDGRDLYGYITGGPLYVADPAEGSARAASLDPVASAVARFFFLGAPLDPAALPTSLEAAVGPLDAAGMVRHDGGSVRPDGWIVAATERGYLIAGTPPWYPGSTSNASRAYLGEDSLILARMLPSMVGRSILDLGAGAGVHGLLCADGARRAVLTEIDRGALRIAELNAALNRVAHPVEFRVGDAYLPVVSDRFDVIVTLAPYIPTVPEAESSSVFAGGRDGLAVLRRFIAGASARLEAGGEFIAVAQLLADGDGPLLARELDELAPELAAHLTIDAWCPLQPYAVELAGRLSAHGAPLAHARLAELYSTSLRGLGATGVATTRIRLRKPARGASPASPVVRGRSSQITASEVWALAPGVALDCSAPIALVVTSGSAHPVDAATAALVGALGGGRSIAEAVAVAWGPAPEGLARDLADQAIRRLGDLRVAGLVARAGLG